MWWVRMCELFQDTIRLREVFEVGVSWCLGSSGWGWEVPRWGWIDGDFRGLTFGGWFLLV